MKRIFILLAVLAMAACNSGRSNAELEALSGMNVNDTLTRVDLVKMDIARQREIFNALSPEKKSDLYRYKIYKDIKNNEFTKEERAEMTGLLKKVIHRGKINLTGSVRNLRAGCSVTWDGTTKNCSNIR
ncbi:MAG: hypothetical protein NC308_06865 [Clostridium sp.]|nr:hypothetical protein [Bacteroides sp.]MCM1198592.1 hypothetical protein [Clostridium sp.]